MASQISQAIKAICDEKLLTEEAVLEAVEASLAAAYRKDFGNKNQNIKCEFDPEKYDGETAGIRIFDVKNVVEDMELPDDYFERFDAAHGGKKPETLRGAPGEKKEEKKEEIKEEPKEESKEAKEGESAEGEEEEEFVFNPKTMIMLSDARDLKPDAELEDEIRVELNIPAAFGRMAAQTAKQVIMQKLREAERNVIYQDFKEREGELMNVTIQRREGRIVLIDLGRATGIILPEDQIEGERYYAGTRIKAILREVTLTNKGPEIRLSRSSPGLVAALAAQEIPEIANGVVEIKDIAREAGSRTKIAVSTNDDMIDPIGSCIGQRGTRIQTIIRELGGEKVDVVLWSEDTQEYILNSLSPAKAVSIEINEDEHLALVQVTSDQLSLAIGKGGQNVRLAAKLTGWKITVINTDSDEVVADSDIGVIAEDVVTPTEDSKETSEEPKEDNAIEDASDEKIEESPAEEAEEKVEELPEAEETASEAPEAEEELEEVKK
ncbi:MAG: transcription termination factor NusA [Patescibacteria group bacterium]|nr:transcription termination factor NusA [Patescibacteria group bacterium]